MNGWSVGEATPTEREALLRRERELFGADSALRADWLFDRNPAGRALVLVARGPDRTVVGTRSLLPWRVSADGKEVLVGQYARSWTEPTHRKLGVSVAIGRELNRRSVEIGYPMIFLFPSVRSIPGHRTVGNRLVVTLERRQILGSVRFFSSRAPGFLDRGVRLVRRARGRRARGGDAWAVDPEAAATAAGLWNPDALGGGVHGMRDAAFLAWRYSPESGREYVGWRTPLAGAARFSAFVHRAGRRARILEVMGRDDPGETAAAVSVLAEQLIGQGAYLVEWCPPRHGRGPEAADRAGFFRRRSGVPLGLWFNRPPEESGALGDPSRYHLTEGDSDYA